MMVTEDIFPAAPRVFYRKAPLVQVTSQLRFPPILKIGRDAPVEFQEKVRSGLPLLERPMSFPLTPQLPPQIAEAMMAQTGIMGWRFSNEARDTIVALSQDALTLTTTKYHSWGEFVARLNPALLAFSEIYSPAFYGQVSLRYQDFIIRESVGLASVPWSRLLRPEILGEAANPNFEDRVEALSRVIKLRLPGNTLLSLQHGLGKKADTGESGYLIDLDFATTNKIEVNDVRAALTGLHQYVWRAFRWCISETLHDALEPAQPEADAA